MDTGSFLQDVVYTEARPKIDVILETPFSKEIRIAMVKEQVMNDHSAPLPIAVCVMKGSIEFRTKDDMITMQTGDIVGLEPSVKHNLLALEESVVRLTLAKADSANRVKEAANS